MTVAVEDCRPEVIRGGSKSRARVHHLRVLHVINGEDYSGAERVQDLLALQLPAQGFQVGFACIKPDRFAAARQSQDSPLYNVPMKARWDLRPAWRLARLVRRERYAVVHSHSARLALLAAPAAALAGVPFVHHVHCQTSTEVRQPILSRVNALVERAAMRRVSAIIAVSASLRKYLLANGYAPESVHLVPNGVPGRESLPDARPPQGTWTIGAIAMFRPRKGIESLLAALAKLCAAGLDVRLRAVGRFQTPEYEQEILALSQSLGLADAVDWVGFRRDVAAELDQIDLFVLPSVIAEAMPMSILEAMAAGVPVVGTRVDGITDLINDGQDGVLAQPNDADDLAAAMGRVIRGQADWSALRRAAFDRQVESFSDHAMAQGIADVYRRILTK